MNDHYLTLAIIDAHVYQPTQLRVVKDTRSIVRYDDEDPVIIRERKQKRSTWTRMVLP